MQHGVGGNTLVAVGSDEDVDALIALCGGNAREAVRALRLVNARLGERLDTARRSASSGYLRARPAAAMPA